MKSWEFLIQQEGDRVWHPIDTPSLEITPGKYRIMAHTHRTNADIDVRIVWQTHNSTETHHHSQQLTRRTNEEGLVMILPFSELQPGIWEIRCCNDIFSELLGQVWQEKLSLHVLSAPAALPLNLKSEMSQENRANMNQSAANAQDYLQQLEQLLRQEIEPKLNDPPSEITSNNFTLNEAVSQAKPINYTIELFSTEANASCTFDLQVTATKADTKLPLALPQPTQACQMSRTAAGQVLPPKLARTPVSPQKPKKSLKLPQFSAQNDLEKQPSTSQSVQSGFLEDRFLASLNQLP